MTHDEPGAIPPILREATRLSRRVGRAGVGRAAAEARPNAGSLSAVEVRLLEPATKPAHIRRRRRTQQSTLRPVEWLRYLVERFLIVPAAGRLPLRAALRLCDIVAVVEALLPVRETRAARREVRAAAGGRHRAPFRGVCRRLSTPRRDLVYLARMRNGQERVADWQVFESNADRVKTLFAGTSAFLLAGAHFSSAALNVASSVLPGPAAFLAGDTPERSLSPSDLRARLSGAIRDGARRRLLAPDGGRCRTTIDVPGLWADRQDQGAPRQRVQAVHRMLQTLAQPRGIVVVRIDVGWQVSGAHQRPFAGASNRSFALGVARVARLAQCPVVPFVAVMGPAPRTVLLEWGEPIPPPPRQRGGHDTLVLDRALDHLEKGIGRFPSEYCARIGWERVWSAATETWEEPS